MGRIIKSSNLTRKEEQQRRKAKEGRQITIFATVLGILILAGVLAVLLWQSGVVKNHFPAITVDGKNYKLSEYNYYYYANYNAYLNDYNDYVEYMFDKSQPLKEQAYDENQSWFEFFQDGAVKSMTGILETAALAKEAGYQLSDSGLTQIESSMEEIKGVAEGAGTDMDKYLETVYGKDMTETVYREHLTNSYLAAEYSEQVKEEFAFTKEEVQEYYKEHLENYTFVNYERFYVKAGDIGTEPAKKEKEDALSIANQIYDRLQKGEELKTITAEFQEKGTYYSFDDAYYDPSFSYGDWLFSSERKDNDANVIDDGAGYYVMVFHSRNESSYAAANIIDVCYPVEAASVTKGNEDSAGMNQLLEDSCKAAEKLLEEWNAGEKTAEHFQELALEQETLSETDGTFENLTRGTLDSKIDEWVFDSERKQNDCSVLYTEGGFHVVYYTGSGTEAWKVAAESDLRGDAYEQWYKNLLDTAKVKLHGYILGFAGDKIYK